MKIQLCLLLVLLSTVSVWAQQKKAVKKPQDQTYAEKLGWRKGDRVVILHIDDAGMSYDSNQGTIRALEEGVANSVSVMMPCPWVPGFVRYLQAHPTVDAGLHLTLTAEWRDYRWGAVAGNPAVPGLIDPQGALWPEVQQVVAHGSPDEVEKEIRAQLQRARAMGLNPTHLDSHMGTLFATPEFLERYIKVGVEERIPVMFPGGHNSFLTAQYQEELKQQLISEGRYTEGQALPIPPILAQTHTVGQTIWQAGLPVLDDLHNMSYGWHLPEGVPATAGNLQKMKTARYVDALQQMKPGVTMVIMHCTDPTEVFAEISDSGPTRHGDLLAMLDPALREVIRKEKIILTTWRELKARRDKVGQQ
ncbi:polysaccharide deacetylase family protein [Pontibacter sp. E15-1]|uniref:polysaccharide deacetylase family protein n=1 Tax=Pontibacter sp. E15-1 TaxID=2919918 RepID=UPI001F502D09|nr:polysaccharide deacetylase family protein [Pontibacter sp. E15-1]MCJ8166961.1 polysaccharide deacetylase family protein [Pontibacter sp. E15-1]